MRPMLLVVGFTFACTRLPQTEDVWVTVNDHAITHGEVERLSRTSHGAVPQRAVLESLISQELAAQRAEEQQLLPDEAGLKELARAEAELNAVRRRVLSN